MEPNTNKYAKIDTSASAWSIYFGNRTEKVVAYIVMYKHRQPVIN